MTRRVFGLTVALSLASTVFATQQRPNFSGTWVGVSPAEISGQQETIKQTVAILTVRRRGSDHVTTNKLDGSESDLVIWSHGSSTTITTSAKWDGERLVISELRTYQPEGRKTQSRTVWSLDRQGQMVRDFTTIDVTPELRQQTVWRKK